MSKFENNIKNTLISLSILTDSQIPHRTFEIKELLKNEQWKNPDFIVKIKQSLEKLENDNSFIEVIPVDIKKSWDGNSRIWKKRQFHSYSSIYDQIAIGYKFHDLDFLDNLQDFYKKFNKKIRQELNIEHNRTNYGNITYKSKYENGELKKPLCIDEEKYFYPYYEDWKKQWKMFNDRISQIGIGTFVIKLDFKEAYNLLDFNDIEQLLKYENSEPINELRKVLLKYKYKDGKVCKGVPYGGPIESHMIANALILLKLKKICETVFIENNFKVIDIISYADDTCIVIDNESMGVDKNKLKNVLSEYCEEYKFHPLREDDNSKTAIFEISDNQDLIKLKNSYSSSSTINALFLTQRMSENNFEITWKNKNSDPTNKSDHIFERKELISQIYNTFTIKGIDFNKFFHEKNIKYIPILFSHLIKRFNLDIEVQLTIDKLLKYNLKYSNKLPTISDTLELLQCYITAIESGIERNKLTKLFIIIDRNLGQDWIRKSLNSLKPISYNSSMTNNDRIIEISSDDEMIEGIFKLYKTNVSKYEFLLSVIYKISKLNSCDYLKITIRWLFNDEEINEDSYWQLTKSKLLHFFNKMFEEGEVFLMYRFNKLVQISENRIELIKNMQYLKKSIDSFPDINRRYIHEYDKMIFNLIKNTPDNLVGIDSTENYYNIDILFTIRELTKTLWENGSFSTQTYTNHNHLHGDKLLLNYHQFRSNYNIRSILNHDTVDIFPLIASFYLHDIGMLYNGDVNREFSGNIKMIYEKIANYARENHGRKSSDIVINIIAKMLDLPFDWIMPICYASIAHKNGYKTLKGKDKKMENTALILSILDLLDITFDREALSSRIITGTIASDYTKCHWLKHYIVSSLNFSYNNNTLNLDFGIDSKAIKYFNIKINNHENICDFFKNNEAGKLIVSDISEYLIKNVNSLLINIWNGNSRGIKICYNINEMDTKINCDIPFFEEENFENKLALFEKLKIKTK